MVDACEQTTPYTNAMWADALTRIRPEPAERVRRVLMLGLAAGGALKAIYKEYPGCSITAIEHDPEMIRIAEDLALYKPYPKPTIIQADAESAVASLKGQFDLIVIDLFTGEEPPAFIAEDSFIKALAKRLAPQGRLLANVYKKTEYLDALDSAHHSHQRWAYRYNSLGLFSNPKI